MKFRTLDLLYIALFAALTAICAWISVPAAIPFTFQTFAVFFTLLALGGKRGTLSVSVYLLLGAVGLPIFSGFRGGVGILFGATGGFLLGFLLICLIFWLFTALFGEKAGVFSLVSGLLVSYILGTLWYALLFAKGSGLEGFASAFTLCVLPFVIPDAVKLILAFYLSKRLKKFVK